MKKFELIELNGTELMQIIMKAHDITRAETCYLNIKQKGDDLKVEFKFVRGNDDSNEQ